jgi:hypothetical protein
MNKATAQKDAERHESLIIKYLVTDKLAPTHPLVLKSVRLARANRDMLKPGYTP